MIDDKMERKVKQSLSIEDVRKMFISLSTEEDFKKFVDSYHEALKNHENPSIISQYEYYVGLNYQRGITEKKDVKLAKLWYFKSYVSNDNAKYELFELLWRDKTDDVELASIANNLASKGDAWGANRIGRMYQFGRFYKKDLKSAEVWMRKSVALGALWANNELFDVLWQIGTPESYHEMISVANNRAAENDGNAMGRLGRAYRDGKGVKQNLEIAAGWMRKAMNLNVVWARWELFDILWRIGTPEAYSEMISSVKPFADDGNAELKVRMGRAYREGKGVKRDLGKAREYFEKAAAENPKWEKELETVGNKIEIKEKKYWKIIKSCNFTQKKVTILSTTHKGFMINLLNFGIIRNLQNCIMMIPNGLRYDNLCDLVRLGFLQEIIEYDCTVGFKSHKCQTFGEVVNYYDEMLSDAGVNNDNICNVYSIADGHDQAGCYFISKGFSIHLIEALPGQLNEIGRYEYVKQSLSPEVYELQKSMDVLCNSKGNNSYYNENREYSDSKFDFNHSFELIDDKQSNKLDYIFNKDIDYNGSEVIAFNSPSYMINVCGLKSKDYSHVLSVLLDQFVDFSEKVIVKLHPYSISDKSFSIRGVFVDDGKRDIETIKYNPKTRIKKLICMKSSVTDKIKDRCDVMLIIGNEFYRQYFYYPIVEFFVNKLSKMNVGISQDIIDIKSWNQSKLHKVHSEIKTGVNQPIVITDNPNKRGSVLTILINSNFNQDNILLKNIFASMMDSEYSRSNYA